MTAPSVDRRAGTERPNIIRKGHLEKKNGCEILLMVQKSQGQPPGINGGDPNYLLSGGPSSKWCTTSSLLEPCEVITTVDG